jgi:hypothetical protein
MEKVIEKSIREINSFEDYKMEYFPETPLSSKITIILNSTKNIGSVFATDTLKKVEEVLLKSKK